MKHHIIISGTGRAGTTFLIQLFTALGFDTGFDASEIVISDPCRAGLELDIRDLDAPYIVKSPYLCDYLNDVLATQTCSIDHAFIPMRSLYSAAESRRAVQNKSGFTGAIRGGLWDTDDPGQQEAVLAQKLYSLLHTLCVWDVPLTLLRFPRLVNDADYLYAKLSPVFPDLSVEQFSTSFASTVRPDLVHNYR